MWCRLLESRGHHNDYSCYLPEPGRGQVRVRVSLVVRPLADGRLSVPLDAEAVVVPEPGGAER